MVRKLAPEPPSPLIGQKIKVRCNEGNRWSLAKAGEDGEEATVVRTQDINGEEYAYLRIVEPVGGGQIALMAVPSSQLSGKAKESPKEEE